MNSLCLQLWVVLYSWNSRSWCSLPTPTDAKLVLSYLPCQIHLLTLSFNIFVCFVVFFSSFFHLLLFFAISTSSLSLDIKFAILCTQKRFMRFFVAKTIFAIFAGKNDLHTSSGNFLRVQICHPKSLDIWSWSSSRVAKTCRPCDPVGAIFSGRC